MAESLQGIRALPTGDFQSILEDEWENDSQRSLQQVPNETINATGLSSIHQNLSSSFSHLRRGLANCMADITNHKTQWPWRSMQINYHQSVCRLSYQRIKLLSKIFMIKTTVMQSYLDISKQWFRIKRRKLVGCEQQKWKRI